MSSPRRRMAGSAGIILVTAAVLLCCPVGDARTNAPKETAARTIFGVSAIPKTIKVLMPDKSVQEMDLDEYVKGTIPAEMANGANMDMLEAEAICSRTFAASGMRHGNANVCTANNHCQYWSDVHTPRGDLAVEATHGVGILQNNQLITAYYTGHCVNGHTRNSEEVYGYTPYCRSVSCPCGQPLMWGSGVGMCQTGAQILGASGWDYYDILNHYYTGVTV